MEDLELAILEIIERIYNAKYKGCIAVKEIKDCVFSDNPKVSGYELILGMHVSDKPLRLAIDGTPELFLKYIAKELKTRRLDVTKYFSGYMVDPDS